MSYRNRKKSTIVCVIVLIIVFCTVFSIVQNTSSLSDLTFAVDSTYTNVLDDLNSDNTFNISDYPAKSDDYSLNVIQIAESSDKELFVYVYQPCNNSKRLTATAIRISIDIDNPHYVDYKLTLINSDGVFVKYKVENLTLSENSIRYYEIVSIFRDWEKNIDLPSSSGNEISSVAFSVKQLWTVKNDNGSVIYDKTIRKVIEIDNKYVGFVRYSDGEFFLHREACDSHFVAFSTDINIDQLFEADVSFVAKSYKKNVAQIDYTNVENKDVTLTYKDKVNNSANGLFAKKYIWDRIQTVDDFIKTNSLSDEAINNLSGMKWVLRFYETKYSVPVGMGSAILGGVTSSILEALAKESTGVAVTDVSVLRLNFESKGKVYNLGVVDNKQTGSSKPANEEKNLFEDFIQILKDLFNKGKNGLSTFMIILIVVIIILLLVFLICALPSKKSANKIVIENTDNKTTKKYKKKSKK